jgi:hypothetical protein
MPVFSKQTEVCGVSVRRENASFQLSTGRIAVGHQWIEFVDDNGQVTFSTGFWPSGNIWQSRGAVEIPDPYEGEANSINARPMEKKFCRYMRCNNRMYSIEGDCRLP